MLKKFRRLVLFGAMLGMVLVPVVCNSSVFAVDVVSGPCSNAEAAASSVCQDSQSTTNPLFGPDGVLTVVVKILSLVVGVLAIIFIIIQGIRITLSAGDSQKVKSARSGIIYALVGVAVAAFAQVIVAFVLNKVQ
jgi:hypothetical protein